MTFILRTVDADIPGQVDSHRFVEIPITGPGDANTLVVITGVAILQSVGVDTDDLIRGQITMLTDYKLQPGDRFTQIVNNNQQLLAASFISLASMAVDDDEFPGTPTGFTLAVDTVETAIAQDNRVQFAVGIALQGESELLRISYQANVLIQKA